MDLFEECIQALGGKVSIFSTQEKKNVITQMITKYPITNWARIDWNNIVNKRVTSLDAIYHDLNELGLIQTYGPSVFILWDEGTLPLLSADIIQVMDVIDDVTAVSFDTFLYASSGGYIVEIYHDGEVTIGWDGNSENH